MATAQSPRDLDHWFTALDIGPAARPDGAGSAGDVVGEDSDDDFGLDEPGPAPDWADSLDDQFTEMARDRQAAAADTQRRRNRLRYSGILAAAIAVVAGSAVWLTTPDSPQASPPNTSTSPAATAPAAGGSSPTTASVGECPSQVHGDVVTGADHGGTDSGPNAILAFEAAYYLDRSGTKAREVTTAEAAVPPAQAIQQGIDSVPRGTTHCVTITPAGVDAYAVDLTETRPDTGTSLYRQTITITHRDGRVLITGITAR
ncbi:hypothetical protein ACFXG4_30375 [Nocardia sp. NPDC059246]|uniref:hypothetical protein n=1 Tax=unclassified Nocardia TaxID=2637762 RepID=UPI0036A622EB